ncbi:MAG: DNA-binding NtrC family response regulator/GGDEF domain-containing protein [Halioglobus sp.]|jgi:DNA-binding NtrC family response regulator/GGDEF domain-containing protein
MVEPGDQNLHFDEMTEACLTIDARSGEILKCNDAAEILLGRKSVQLLGAKDLAALGCDDDSSGMLKHALQAGQRVSLPSFVISHSDGLELAVGGLLIPAGDTSRLLLWPLLSSGDLQSLGTVHHSDTLVVLGVDRLRYDASFGANEAAHLMRQFHSSLLEIVRSQDSVGEIMGTTIVVLLRDVDIEGAENISRALLSHLHNVHTRKGTPGQQVRICIGLARMEASVRTLTTLLAANNALLQARLSSGAEHVRVAQKGDAALAIGHLMNASGAFSDHPESPVSAASEQSTQVSAAPLEREAPPIAPIETNIDGYVVDNMEGAVDQAVFMAKLDVPVAIIGPAGTGKMYVAKVIHDESGGAPDMLVSIDCREFRSRSSANTRIAKELAQGLGKTLVFKSPHLMNSEAQLKLAKQVSSRQLADVSPPQYLPKLKLIALFPDSMEMLMRKGELTAPLASAFSGYPITVPPIRDRKQAVLRWAHKVLGQEGAARDRHMKGFTPDAERAMLVYDWPGNISEMRRCIYEALEKTDKDWLTPVDLGLFKGIDPEGAPVTPESTAFLVAIESTESAPQGYIPSTAESLDVALGEAIHNMLELDLIKPLGTWLEDDLVAAALDRYRNDVTRAAGFLHTKPRNINRWLPKIQSREEERGNSSLWQIPRRLVSEWVRESAQIDESPLLTMQDKLMAHLTRQGGALSAAKRARIMGVSTPTYVKRLRELDDS